jgi:hypothetical protein
MGNTTDFIGHIDIDPPLNDDEIAYLSAFSASRRCERSGGPYVVPGNPRAESPGDFDGDAYDRPATGQPGLWCQWAPCWGGCCLTFNGHEKRYSPVPWLRYLIAHFLKPGAHAARAGGERFQGFTFDHRLDGMVIACRRDNNELYAIVVSNNRVREQILTPADPRYVERPPLPYEEAIDRVKTERVRRQRRRGADVIPFRRSM